LLQSRNKNKLMIEIATEIRKKRAASAYNLTQRKKASKWLKGYPTTAERRVK